MYKLIVSDLDGTLVDSNKNVSEYTKDIVNLLKQKGIEFIIATGRSYKGAKHVYDTLKLDTEIICNNGTTIYNSNGDLIFQRTIDPKITLEVFKKSLEENCIFFATYGVQVFIGEGTIEEANTFLYNPLDNPIEINLDNINQYIFEKIVLMDKNGNKLKYLSNFFNQYDEINAFISQEDYLDIVHFETSKGQAVKTLANLKNIDLKNVIAFGDAFNDYEMLKVAGKGLVMGNAFEDLKKEFETIGFTNDESGVAKYLANLFLLNK
ncbi:Cof-type HAD-IIB family hydrolase [Cetobacterium somerae]|uniref:Cof-type HAD-IIB family hydrolase n=1 Tax=Cetobacterium sp. NK01 TaxID=2993530 RepID=UPI002116B463|nr:Cof-type HAD-IIB family hydrolase [Cetobacterium sp. NK01]MCQ8212821.1 Cof-type HAD-IIB family hydrolase [Cetobacterium sp. NK01]